MTQRATSRVVASAAICTCLLATSPATASNAAFQDFLFDICATASGALATRCAETDGGLGNVSGDSESSLNPSQFLAGNSTALEAGRDRDAIAGSDSAIIEIDEGRWAFSLSGRWLNTEFDQRIDADPERSWELDGSALTLGLDVALSDRLVVGASLHVERSELAFARELAGRNFSPVGNAGEIESDATGGSLFAGFTLGERGYLDVAVGYLQRELTIERRAVFQESNRLVATSLSRTRGDADGTELWAAINAGYNIERGALRHGPFATLTLTDAELDGFTERDLSGAGLAMRVASTDSNSQLASLGWQGSYSISAGNAVWLPSARLAVQSLLSDSDADANARYVLDSSNTSLALAGSEQDQTTVLASIGVLAVFGGGWSGFVEAQSTFSDQNADRLVISAGLRKAL